MEKTFFISFIFYSSWTSTQKKPVASAEELAGKLANPVANLIAFPRQNNTDYGIGPYYGSRNMRKIQPVVPINLSPQLNLITRYSLPVITQNDVMGEGKKDSGPSDMQATAFFAPGDIKNGFIWGVGPTFLILTGANDFLKQRKLSRRQLAMAVEYTL